VKQRTTDELVAGLDEIRQSPSDGGSVEMIVARPAVNERSVLETGELTIDEGLVGDTWTTRGSRHTPDGSAEVPRQLTLMNARAIALFAGDRERWPLAGDQLYVDLDLSDDNLPPGSRLELGSAVVEVSVEPHTGCAKFAERFGMDVARFVNSPDGKALHLRGINARVVVPGMVRVGDAVKKTADRTPR
jgi:MOSC domain-containing protein YiiM